MFKSTRWRSEKNKIKVIIKLQFQATQVPQLGWDTMTVALVPLDVGKPTVKSEKAAVHDGTCRWESPIYETTRFTQEPKTGKINDKIYKFLVSTGSSKTSFIGEATLNFADYAEAIKPVSVSLPLKTASISAVLHVTIQRIQTGVDGRVVEESGDLMVRSNGRTLQSQLSNCDKDVNEPTNGTVNCNSTKDDFSIMGHTQRGLSQNQTGSQQGEYNGIVRVSSGSDVVSASSLDSSSGQETPRELKNNKEARNHRRSNTEWSVSSAPDGIIDDLTSSSVVTLLKESSDIYIEKLKNEISVLSRQSEVSELELQTLRKQIAKEGRRGNDLAREVCSIKEERDALRSECEQLKASKMSRNKQQLESEDRRYKLEDIKQELNYEKDLNANLRLQLQKTQESNSQLILAVQELEELLEQKNKEASDIMHDEGDLHLKESKSNGKLREMHTYHEMKEGEEQHVSEVLVKDHVDAKVDSSLQQKITELSSELEVCKKDLEDVEMQMEQLALDYEILKQENHDMSLKLEQSQLQEQLKMQYECASSFAAINELEMHVESLEQELKQQHEAFEIDLAAVMHEKVKQEQRAVRAEEALRKTRWKNASTAERLQEEIKKLTMQISSTFEANEKLAMRALTEASELRLQKGHLEELLERAKEDLGVVEDRYEEKLQQLLNQIEFQTTQTEQLLLDLEDKSKELDNLKKSFEARETSFSKEVSMLQTEIKSLEIEKSTFSGQVAEKEILKTEVEQLRISVEEMELSMRKGETEREELEGKLALLREEADKPLKELNEAHSLIDEKQTMIGALQSEMETLSAQYNELKHSLSEGKLEKENLRKRTSQLRADLQKKEDKLITVENKLKDDNAKVMLPDENTKLATKSNKGGPALRGSKEISSLREKIKLLEEDIKQKEAALETTTNCFLQKEKDLWNRVEELEKCVEEISQNNFSVCKNNLGKDEKNVKNIIGNSVSEDGTGVDENLVSEMGNQECLPEQNGINREPMRSNEESNSLNEQEASNSHTIEQGAYAELLSEVALLKERNKTMGSELKEMQERYSEISLKFAEVEGERQQLVMTIRNLKNSKKN